jgi:hypothetical protein
MSKVVWNPLRFLDYRDYGSLSIGIWSLLWLFLYLRSYNLVGSVTVAPFSLSMSIEDGPLLWILVRSQPYSPKHILAYGSGKARYSLVVDSGSFQIDWLEARIGGGISTTLRPDLKGGGLESKFGQGPRPLDRSGMGWYCLCLGYKRDVCFLGYLARLHWFVNRHFYVTVWLGYDLAP